MNKAESAPILSLIHISEPTRLQLISYAVFCLKKSKRITVRHFYSLVPMSVVSSPKATPQESSPGAPKVFR